MIDTLNVWQRRALIVGATAAVVSIVGLFSNRAQFFHSYLFAWLFWAGLSFGALVVVMMQNLTGGQWGLAVRPLSVATFRTLPLAAALFAPVLLGLHDIYSWSNGIRGETDGYHHKAQYLNTPFFIARSIIYFAVVISIAALLHRKSVNANRRTAAVSAAGLIAYVLCMNFASTDWVMSLKPQWYSTIFVEVFAAGQFLSALAFVTALLTFFASQDSVGRVVPTKAFHDLGNMLLAFVIFWTYVAFSQFLIIWSGNLPKEISWYLDRSRGGWEWFAALLALLAFLLPFALLLSRAAKRHRARLGGIAALILGANVLTNFWWVAPTFHPAGVYFHWLDFAEFVAMGGLWCAVFFHFAKQHPILPAEWVEVAHG